MKKLLFLLLILTNSLCYSQRVEGISPAGKVAIFGPEIDAMVFIKDYVEERISTWQVKGEFEKTAVYKTRVNDESRLAKADEYALEALDILESMFAKTIQWEGLSISDYDADNEVFQITHPRLGIFIVPVEISSAPTFKSNFQNVKYSNPNYSLANNKFQLAKLTIINPVDNKKFIYDNNLEVTYMVQNIEYNFPEIELTLPSENTNAESMAKINQQYLKIGKDSVDTHIPLGASSNSNTFAVVIGNEHYMKERSVPFANNDASIFSKYLTKTLGVPKENVRLVLDASYGQMLGVINWITEVTKAYKGDATIIFYYAGHGMPDESSKDAFLLPVDGSSDITGAAVKLDNLYSNLGEHPAKQVVIFMDACFSGGARDGMLADGRGVRIKPKENTINGNLVIFAASSGDQTAHSYDDKGHGLFTYFILKKLQETKGNVTLGDLTLFVKLEVEKVSIVKNDRSQTPKVKASENIRNTWGDFRLTH